MHACTDIKTQLHEKDERGVRQAVSMLALTMLRDVVNLKVAFGAIGCFVSAAVAVSITDGHLTLV